MTCEKCWGEAYVRMMTLGGSQTEHYHALLEERNCETVTLDVTEPSHEAQD